MDQSHTGSAPKIGDWYTIERRWAHGRTVVNSHAKAATSVTTKRVYFDNRWFALSDPDRVLRPKYLDYVDTAVRLGAVEGNVGAPLVDWEAEAKRLRKLFDDAGQGEHNVLALVDHYQRNSMDADERLRAVCKLLEANGCECPCDHHPDERSPDCEVCLACLIGEAVGR